ncbi:ribosomal protein S18-alanine N-acetyltransferase [Tepidiphilus olei]|uniref:ribosomal protein S18-alanine N-acetyltransferase n=1 Tax=Tepidiphilus olei TaxID=2502184 RepID=UPI001C8F26EC|nr:ribosomal protein S18-alanine N-acetyltransferase [Tepidiphilus olei]
MNWLRLRAMREDDLPWVTALERTAQEIPWSEKSFREALTAGYACWMAEVLSGDDPTTAAAEPVGFLILLLVAGEAEILNLAIDPAHRGRGLGREMLEAALEEARERGATTVWLEVRVSNQAAIALYQRSGFAIVARRRGYYATREGAREDALVMQRELVR